MELGSNVNNNERFHLFQYAFSHLASMRNVDAVSFQKNSKNRMPAHENRNWRCRIITDAPAHACVFGAASTTPRGAVCRRACSAQSSRANGEQKLATDCVGRFLQARQLGLFRFLSERRHPACDPLQRLESLVPVWFAVLLFFFDAYGSALSLWCCCGAWSVASDASQLAVSCSL